MQASHSSVRSVPSVNMSTIGRGLESTIAVNPRNPSNIIVTHGNGGTIATDDRFPVALVTSDGGATWRVGNSSISYVNSVATPHLANNWGYFDQVATFSANGDAYVGTVQGDGPADYLFKSTDGGNNYLLTNPFLEMNDSLLFYQHGTYVHPCNDAFRDYPAVIADPYPTSPYHDNVYTLVRVGAQISPTVCGYGAAFERSTDGGKTWGNGTWFFGADPFISDNRGMAVAPDGTVYLAGLGPSCLYSISCFSSGCPATNNNVGMVFKSNDGGASFSQAICAVDDPNFGLENIEVAASSSKIYVVFLGDNETAAPNRFHLYSLVSSDGGANWSKKNRIDDLTLPDTGHVVNAGGPWMWDFSLSQRTGRLDVAWLDGRNNRGNYTLGDIYYSYSFDGRSWAANIRATPQGPYYMCNMLVSDSLSCGGAGNDFMWVTNSNRHGDQAYIVTSIGTTTCTSSCSTWITQALYTRLVTVTFPHSHSGLCNSDAQSQLNSTDSLLLLDNCADPEVIDEH